MGIGTGIAIVAFPFFSVLFARLLRFNYVEKFFVFYDPWISIVKIKIGKTIFGLGWLPLGSYIRYNRPPNFSEIKFKIYYLSHLISFFLTIFIGLCLADKEFTKAWESFVNTLVELYNLAAFQRAGKHSLRIIQDNMRNIDNIIPFWTCITCIFSIWGTLWETFSKIFSDKVGKNLSFLGLAVIIIIVLRIFILISFHSFLSFFKGCVYTSIVLFLFVCIWGYAINAVDKKTLQ